MLRTQPSIFSFYNLLSLPKNLYSQHEIAKQETSFEDVYDLMEDHDSSLTKKVVKHFISVITVLVSLLYYFSLS